VRKKCNKSKKITQAKNKSTQVQVTLNWRKRSLRKKTQR